MAEGVIAWSVVGVGIAGRARARAIQKDARARLVAVWRGRNAAELGVPVVGSLDEAIARADAVAVCSPTAAHAEQVRAVLAAGRHAIVEFPLATTVVEGEALFALARLQDRVLHVEHIELLDAPHRTLAAHVRGDMVRSVTLTFTRPGPAGADAATLAGGNEARLHRLIGVAGPVASVDRVDLHPGSLDAELTLVSGAPVRCSFRQAPSLPRHLRVEIHTVTEIWEQDGDVLLRNGANQTLLGPASLFVSDQRAATARILDGAPPYVSDERVLHVLDVVERLAEGRSGGIPPR